MAKNWKRYEGFTRKGNQIGTENEMRYNDDSGRIIRLTSEVVEICSHESKGSGPCKSPFKVRVDLQPRNLQIIEVEI
jgi:hypothetical protein